MRTAVTDRWAERVCGAVSLGGNRLVTGYAYDALDLSIRLVVELRVDGLPLALARADHVSEDLRRSEVGDARYGFAFAVPDDVWKAGGRAQVVVANSDHPIAPPLEIGGSVARDEADLGVGGVTWRGGLDLSGWVRPTDGAAPRVRISIDGRLVAEARADRWRHRPVTGGARPVRAFLARLPEGCADGRTRRVSVRTEDGEHLWGSPISIVALPEPLEACAARAYGPDLEVVGERARLFDRLAPRAAPLDAWESWRRAHPPPSATGGPLLVALIGDEPDAVRRSLDSLRADPTLDWVAVALPSPDRIGFASGELAAFVRERGGSRAALVAAPAGTVFEPGAPARLTAALAASAEASLVYGDVVLGLGDGAIPLAFPSFDYERWLEQGYGATVFAVRTDLALSSGAGDLYRLASAAFRGRRPGTVIHVPGFSARLEPLDLPTATAYLARATRIHLAERGVAARVEPGRGVVLPAIRVVRDHASATVSVIVTAHDGGPQLQACLESIRADLVGPSRELIIVDDGSVVSPASPVLAAERAGANIWREAGPLNHARRCNRAASGARGDFLLFLDGGVEAHSRGFLDELLSRVAEPAVAAAGPVLSWSSGVIRHAGLTLGPGFSARSPFTDRLSEDSGYGDLLRVASEPSALGGECLLVRRSSYAALGGMDERHFPLVFGPADLCLRLGARGAGVVVTPHIHVACGGRAFAERAAEPWRRCRDRELRLFRDRWGEALGADPAYNPMLTLLDEPYAGLACPPRALDPRRRGLPAPFALASGL